LLQQPATRFFILFRTSASISIATIFSTNVMVVVMVVVVMMVMAMVLLVMPVTFLRE
jgi:hypothetical protein